MCLLKGFECVARLTRYKVSVGAIRCISFERDCKAFLIVGFNHWIGIACDLTATIVPILANRP